MLIIKPPVIPIITQTHKNPLFILIKIGRTLISPYPPSLSSPAKAIGPATGTSTCALGSHKKKKKYIGSFTTKAKIL